jgi:nucleotide-binding universal stress UspA family protein
MTQPVVVGYDGSESAEDALQFGVGEAGQRGRELHLLHAFTWPLLYPMFAAGAEVPDPTPRVAMLRLLTAAADELAEKHPDVTIRARFVDGSPGGVLVEASRDAALLVVGHRGVGGFTGLLAGAVGTQLAGHARCPVVVVRGGPEHGGPLRPDASVVVGVDDSPASRRAAQAAFDTARRRGSDLLVASWRPGHGPAGAGAQRPLPLDEVEGYVEGVADRYPDVRWEAVVVDGGSAATGLISLADRVRAGLVVVGSRGAGGFRGLLLGSTSRILIEHAPCPVMVAPRTA